MTSASQPQFTITNRMTAATTLLKAIGDHELSSADLIKALGLSHRPTFRGNYLNPAMEGGWIERTQPDSPRSPTQRYRLTDKGRRWLQHREEE